MNNNFFLGLGKEDPQPLLSESNRTQMPSEQNNLNQGSSPVTSSVASMFHFGTAEVTVSGEIAPNEESSVATPAPCPIIDESKSGDPEPTSLSCHINNDMTEEQAVQLIAPMPKSQTTATVNLANLYRLPLAAQPLIQNQAFNLFPHLQSRSDLGSYSGQIDIPASQLASTLFQVQDATTVLEAVTDNLPVQLASNNDTSIDNNPDQLVAASNNAQSKEPQLSLFSKLGESLSIQAQTHNPNNSALSTLSCSTQMVQPVKISNTSLEGCIFKKPLDFTRKVKVIGGKRTHHCIKFMDPIPELPASVDPEYIEQMMAINLAGRDIIRELLSKNPFYILDDIVDNMIADINALDDKFPGCKEVMAQLEFSYNKPNSRPFESSSVQSTSKVAETFYKPDNVDLGMASTLSFKPSSPKSVQPSSNMASISKASTKALSPKSQLVALVPTMSVVPKASSSKSVLSEGNSTKSNNSDFSEEPGRKKHKPFVTQDAYSSKIKADEEGFQALESDDASIRNEEEKAITLAQAYVELSKFDFFSNTYSSLGYGTIWINYSQTSGSCWFVFCADGSIQKTWTFVIPKGSNSVLVSNSSVSFKGVSDEGVSSFFTALAKNMVDAKLLKSALDHLDY